jgi:hypothetical protein
MSLFSTSEIKEGGRKNMVFVSNAQLGADRLVLKILNQAELVREGISKAPRKNKHGAEEIAAAAVSANVLDDVVGMVALSRIVFNKDSSHYAAALEVVNRLPCEDHQRREFLEFDAIGEFESHMEELIAVVGLVEFHLRIARWY